MSGSFDITHVHGVSCTDAKGRLPDLDKSLSTRIGVITLRTRQIGSHS